MARGRLPDAFGENPCTMSKRRSDWFVPGDLFALFGMMVIIPSVAVLGSMLLPMFGRLKTADAENLYTLGVAIGFLGVLFLFIARLPLYRARRFRTIGPGQLDATHRCYYWLGYAAVFVSLVLLWLVWLRAS
jgi:hypothetical protein